MANLRETGSGDLWSRLLDPDNVFDPSAQVATTHIAINARIFNKIKKTKRIEKSIFYAEGVKWHCNVSATIFRPANSLKFNIFNFDNFVDVCLHVLKTQEYKDNTSRAKVFSVSFFHFSFKPNNNLHMTSPLVFSRRCSIPWLASALWEPRRIVTTWDKVQISQINSGRCFIEESYFVRVRQTVDRITFIRVQVSDDGINVM